MKIFLARKSTGNSKVLEVGSKADVWKNLQENGFDLNDFLVLTPQEYQEREIENARKKQVEADNPQLSKMFPITADELARTGEKPFITKSGSDDALSLGGRSIGAVIDGILGDKGLYRAADRQWQDYRNRGKKKEDDKKEEKKIHG
jgi:hypothetical protein